MNTNTTLTTIGTFTEEEKDLTSLALSQTYPMATGFPNISFVAHIQMRNRKGINIEAIESIEKSSLNSAFIWALKLARPTDQLDLMISPAVALFTPAVQQQILTDKAHALRNYYEKVLQYNSASPLHRAIVTPNSVESSASFSSVASFKRGNRGEGGDTEEISTRLTSCNVDGIEIDSEDPNPNRYEMHEVLKYMDTLSSGKGGSRVSSSVLIVDMPDGALPTALVRANKPLVKKGSNVSFLTGFSSEESLLPNFPFSLMLSSFSSSVRAANGGFLEAANSTSYRDLPLLQESVGVNYLVCVTDSQKSWEAYQVNPSC